VPQIFPRFGKATHSSSIGQRHAKLAAMRRLPVILLVLFAPKPVAAAAQVWRMVDQPLTRAASVVQGEGASVRVERHWQGEGKDRQPILAIVVTMPGLEPYVVPAAEGREDSYGLRVGIGKLARGDGRPAVIVEGYTGGAHCCVTFQLVTVVDGVVRTLPLDWVDGDFDTHFPRDIDGDGVVDIQRTDDSFLYAFASYAASWNLPIVYNLRGGALVDVTAEPRYTPLFRQFAARALAHCRKPNEPGRNGACAAYAGAMARLGRGEEGIGTAVAKAERSDWYPDDCTVAPVDYVCPDGKQREFSNFNQALRWFLKAHGYIN
jgi:hypothetical protein